VISSAPSSLLDVVAVSPLVDLISRFLNQM
jgi:hypothetical protein